MLSASSVLREGPEGLELAPTFISSLSAASAGSHFVIAVLTSCEQFNDMNTATQQKELLMGYITCTKFP